MAKEEYEEIYKGYNIKIHYQPVTGDNAKVLFRIWKNSEPAFSLWEKISGTSMRRKMRGEALDSLKEKGLTRIKSMIDLKNFKEGEEYSYWEGELRP